MFQKSFNAIKSFFKNLVSEPGKFKNIFKNVSASNRQKI